MKKKNATLKFVYIFSQTKMSLVYRAFEHVNVFDYLPDRESWQLTESSWSSLELSLIKADAKLSHDLASIRLFATLDRDGDTMTPFVSLWIVRPRFLQLKSNRKKRKLNGIRMKQL